MPPKNPFSTNAHVDSLLLLARDNYPVTPNDNADNIGDNGDIIAAGLYVEDAGAVTFITVDGNTRTLNVPAFHNIQCSVKRVLATGTTSTNIHALIM